ncbi:MAG: hypothetical protein GXO84_02350, partial [Chlorobi bacterium]|nr:hypothetical protein [Chlorobiota bacterium]
GTFFSVFAKVDATNDDKKNYCELNSMELKIMNYKGVINLGITQAKLIPIEYKGTFRAKLSIEVQALYNMPNEFVLVEGSEDLRLTEGQRISVERFLKPMHDTKNEKGKQLSNQVFDEEFFYREGNLYDNDYAKRNEHTGDLWETEIKTVKGSSVGGWICPYAEVAVYWAQTILF